MQKTSEQNTGFSILELTVAIFLIAVILVAIAANMTKSSRSLWEAKSRFYAANMAQNCIEDFNYANQKLSWKEFYGENEASLKEICTLPTATDSDMSYMCCGNDCNGIEGIKGDHDNCAVNALDSTDSLLTVNNINNTQGGKLESGWTTKREYYDRYTDTHFVFKIKKAIGEVITYRQLLTGDSTNPQYDRTTGTTRQTVIVVIEVEWQKYGGKPSDKNRYVVMRQYLDV